MIAYVAISIVLLVSISAILLPSMLNRLFIRISTDIFGSRTASLVFRNGSARIRRVGIIGLLLGAIMIIIVPFT